jgi:hypothetical protein
MILDNENVIPIDQGVNPSQTSWIELNSRQSPSRSLKNVSTGDDLF